MSSDWQKVAPGFDPNDPLYKTTTIEEENQQEVEQVKDQFREIQKNSIDASIQHRFISNQIVSSTGIPTLKPHKDTKARWFGGPNAQGDAAADSSSGLSGALGHDEEAANASGASITPQPVAPLSRTTERHVKNHKIATESKGRFEAIVEKVVSFFPKKDAAKDD